MEFSALPPKYSKRSGGGQATGEFQPRKPLAGAGKQKPLEVFFQISTILAFNPARRFFPLFFPPSSFSLQPGSDWDCSGSGPGAQGWIGMSFKVFPTQTIPEFLDFAGLEAFPACRHGHIPFPAWLENWESGPSTGLCLESNILGYSCFFSPYVFRDES